VNNCLPASSKLQFCAEETPYFPIDLA